MARSLVAALAALAAAPLVLGQQDCPSVADVAAETPELSTLLELVQAAGLADALSDGSQPLTVFAPRDAAFTKLGDGGLETLSKPENRDELTRILSTHVVPGRTVMAADLTEGDELEVLTGGNLEVEDITDTVVLRAPGMGTESRVILADRMACEAVIHVVDTVLVPGVGRIQASEATETDMDTDADTDVVAVVDADADEDVVAVVDDSDDDNDVVAVVADDTDNVDIDGDTDGDDDVVVVEPTDDDDDDEDVDAVTPTPEPAPEPAPESIDRTGEEKPRVPVKCASVSAVALGTPELSRLVDLLDAADLIDDLENSDASVTVFAPTNDAINSLDESTLEALSNDTVQLRAILEAHIVDGATRSEDLSDGDELTTINGETITVGVDDQDRGVTVSASNTGTTGNVVNANVIACKSVVHIIDTVLVPGDGSADAPEPAPPLPEEIPEVDQTCVTPAAVALATPELSKLVELLDAADLVDALETRDVEVTVFAPTNEAIDALGQDALEELSNDIEQLKSILELHIVPGTASKAAELEDGQKLPTVEGEEIEVGISDDVTVTAPDGGSTAKVVNADISACNGVVHIIDTVLVPGSQPPPPSGGRRARRARPNKPRRARRARENRPRRARRNRARRIIIT